MQFDKEKVKIYIDAANFNNRLKDFGFDYKELSYKKLVDKLAKNCVGVNYYISPFLPYPNDEKKHRNYVNQQKFFDSLRTNIPGFVVKEYKMKANPEKPGKFRERRVDNGIGADIIADAALNVYDNAILMTADPDLIPNIEHAINLFKKKVFIALPDHRLAREITEKSTGRIVLSMEFLNACKK